MRRRAFTLIEMVACIAIMALLAAVAGVSLHAQHGTMSLDAAAEQFIAADHQARQRARQTNQPFTLSAEIPAAEDITVSSAAASDADVPEPLHLPGGFHIARARIGGRWVHVGALDVRCSAQGHSASYAVLVDGKGTQTWLVFAGLSGAVERMQDEGQVAEILRSPDGDDAD